MTTVAQMPATPIGRKKPPKKPTSTIRPLPREKADNRRSPRRDVAHAAQKQLSPRKRKPSPPAPKCTSPVVLIDGRGSDRCADRETIHRVGGEARRHEHADTETAEEHAGGPASRAQYSVDAHGRREHHERAEDEVRGLNPSAGTVGQDAEGVPGEVEPLAEQRLSQAHGEIERADDHAGAEKGPGAGREGGCHAGICPGLFSILNGIILYA